MPYAAAAGAETGENTVTDARGPVRPRTPPGAHRRPASAPPPRRPPAQYEPHLDGIFTYCLSVLCEHDEATAALADVLVMAERNRSRLRDRGLVRAWLYALARHACLRRLSERTTSRRSGRAGGRHDAQKADAGAAVPPVPAETAARRRRELAALAWPEAAGTAPDQREALELAVRHGLTAEEVGAVVGLEPARARALLSRAACEVERTRAALAVVETGRCPALARLAGDTQVLLGTALRRELVRHVDECPDCRAAAERAMAQGPWPGTRTPAVLAVVQAPGAVALAAAAPAARADEAGAAGASCGRVPAARVPSPRFDRRGFPLDARDRAARRAQFRHRAVTTTVVAAVVAAPVLALWAAYRGGEAAPTAHDVPVSAPDGDFEGGRLVNGQSPGGHREKGRHQDGYRGPGASPDTPGTPPGAPSAPGGPKAPGDRVSVSSSPSAQEPGPSRPGTPAPGRLTVDAQPSGEDTVITLTASGGSPVNWSAYTQAPWLVLSQTSGVLRPGESVTVTVTVDHAREPEGPWSAQVTFDPSGTTVTIDGTGPAPASPPPPAESESPSEAPAEPGGPATGTGG